MLKIVRNGIEYTGSVTENNTGIYYSVSEPEKIVFGMTWINEESNEEGNELVDGGEEDGNEIIDG